MYKPYQGNDLISDSLEGLQHAEHDVCIVGSGPAGVSCALELARLDRKVLLLESGGRKSDPEQQILSDAERVDPESHDDMLVAVARRLGGTSNLWAGRCVPFDPVDFAERSHMPGVRWPLSLEELEPYYERAADYLGAEAPVFHDPIEDVSAASDAFDFTQIERYSNTPAVQIRNKDALESSKNIDLRLNSTVVDIDFEENGRVRGIVVARPDGARHRIAVKSLVIACGGLETTRLLLAARRDKEQLFGGPQGPLGRHYMAHLVGDVADIEFQDLRFEKGFNFYVDRYGTYVRRRFTPSARLQLEHGLNNVSFWPIVPPIADPAHKSGVLSLLLIALASPALGGFFIAEAIRRRHVPENVRLLPHFRNVLLDLPAAAMFAPSFLYKRYLASARIPGFFIPNRGHRYGLAFHAEQTPNEESRVELLSEADRLGLPKLKIYLKFTQKDAENIIKTHDLLSDWLKKEKVGKLTFRHPRERLADIVVSEAEHGTHQIGTARMSGDRSSGIVDRDLRVFDSPNLYVASSAVFPSSGQCNPTFTISALAIRLARHLGSPRAV